MREPNSAVYAPISSTSSSSLMAPKVKGATSSVPSTTKFPSPMLTGDVEEAADGGGGDRGRQVSHPRS